MHERLIFLDFDGVLRRSGSPLYKLEPDLVERFEAAVRQLPSASIVITSSWREVYGIDSLRHLFALDTRKRIVGVTPIARKRDDYYRHREVLAFLKHSGRLGSQWIAIDDDPEHFPTGSPLLLVDPQLGFDEKAA